MRFAPNNYLFIPGTGTIDDVGYSKGKYHSINVPLRDGIRDPEFVALMYRYRIQ